MISNKKSYGIKLLQLALALSLLHVDPDYSLLQQRLRRWDAQLDLPQGDGWELEMLRTVPMIESQHPYGNRKTMPPLIEDLLRFDDLHAAYKLPTSFNGSAFVMNLHNTTGNSSVQTAALQDLQSNAPGGAATSAVGANGGGAAGGGSLAATSSGEIHINTSSMASNGNGNNNNSTQTPAPELDIYLSPDLLQDQRSIWEQNLADLHDFGELSLTSPYAGLPLKDGQQAQHNNTHLDLSLAAFLHGFAHQSQQGEGAAAALNDSTPHPSSTVTVKEEQLDEEDDADEELLLGLFGGSDEAESTESEEGAVGPAIDSAFINEVEVYEEESEIAEVLYKQDVDLGFSLDQERIINASLAGGNNTGEAGGEAKSLTDDDKKSSAGDNDGASLDDTEKLKALEELQQDKPKADDKTTDPLEDIANEWDGIPFTIDNETGEYIRLPLDELLNDVLQLTEFPLEDELENDSEASTSQAAAALNLISIVSETGEELLDNTDSAKPANKDNDDNFSASDLEDLHNSVGSPLFELDDEAKKELDEMLQSTAPPYHHHPHHHHHHAHHAAAAAAAHHHHQRAVQGAPNYASVGSGPNSAFHRQTAAGGFHHGHHQGRMPPLNRSVSMEQRLQDIATFFGPIPSMGVSDMSPYPPHYPSYSYQGAAQHPAQHPAAAQYGQAPPPPPHHHGHGHGHHPAMLHANSALGDICSASAAAAQPHYGHNLGSAVSSSMHLTNSTHEPHEGAAAAAAAGNHYKMEHDMVYYSNASSDMNHTTDGFINSILNDEDLHLMDMNENFCRMVDNSTSNNSSVLGLPSSHSHGHSHAHGSAGAAGPAGSLLPGGSANNHVAGLSLNGATVVGGAAAVGMTTDLLASGVGAQGGADRLDASSDSAVSSMGSERVPSLSDGEWGEGSDSAQDYHQGKYGGPYDFSYNNTAARIGNGVARQPPVAQKKHQLFGKRDPHKQPPSAATVVTPLPLPTVPTAPGSVVQCQAQAQSIKYEYEAGYTGMGGASSLQHSSSSGADAGAMGPALSKDEYQQHQSYNMPGGFSVDYSVRPPRNPQEMVQHNHTYALPQGSGSLPRPPARDKKTLGGAGKHGGKMLSSNNGTGLTEDEHLTRDEKRARALNVPIAVSDIINLPMDEFNERLSKYDLSENQLSLIRDIRRRGKNKVAAQNCRKRKLDQILTLEDEVNAVVKRKNHLTQERDSLESEKKRISNKFAMLHRHVFQYLRDPEGNPCSPSDYSLQQAADGSVYLLPRDKSDGGSTATAASSAVATAGGGGGGGGGGSMNGHSHLAPSSHSQNHHQAQQQTRLQSHHGQLQQPHHHHQAHQQQQQQQQQSQQQQQQQQQPPHQHHATQHKE